MVEGGMKCVKYLIFFFNLLFWLSGLGIIIVGALVQVDYKKYFAILEPGGFSSLPILLIVVGCIIAIIGFFGCCGAIKENYCMIITFAVLLGTIFIMEIAAGIAAAVLKKEFEVTIGNELKDHIKNYNASNPKDPVTSAMDYMQTDFVCCGAYNASDWEIYTRMHNDTYPLSCCPIIESKGSLCLPVVAEAREGCLPKFKEFILRHLAKIIGVGIGIAFIQVFGVVLACCLGRAIRKEYEVV